MENVEFETDKCYVEAVGKLLETINQRLTDGEEFYINGDDDLYLKSVRRIVILRDHDNLSIKFINLKNLTEMVKEVMWWDVFEEQREKLIQFICDKNMKDIRESL